MISYFEHREIMGIHPLAMGCLCYVREDTEVVTPNPEIISCPFLGKSN